MTSDDDDDMHRPRGRPVLPPAERVRRERERDRVKKRRMRARLVERYLQLTPTQAARLDRNRVKGGFRSTSALIAAIIETMPDKP